MWRPDASQLHGVPYEVAERYGKPHMGAFYTADNVNRYKREDGALCCVCGRRAVNVHHWPPKGDGGRGRIFNLRTKMGIFVLKPTLFAVCEECHRRFEGMVDGAPELSWDWEWCSDEDAMDWWDGLTLSRMGFQPHSSNLYVKGFWVLSENGVTVRRVQP